METNPNYWDCECGGSVLKYIHPKSQLNCKNCGCNRLDMPDSRENELTDYFKLGGRLNNSNEIEPIVCNNCGGIIVVAVDIIQRELWYINNEGEPDYEQGYISADSIEECSRIYFCNKCNKKYTEKQIKEMSYDKM